MNKEIQTIKRIEKVIDEMINESSRRYKFSINGQELKKKNKTGVCLENE